MANVEAFRVLQTWTYDRTSLRARSATRASRIFVKPVLKMWASNPRLPWPYGVLEFLASLLPAVRGVTRTRIVLRNCAAERIRPADFVPGDREPQAILYLHGGAFIVGGVRSHRRLVSRIVRATGVPSLAVDYRQLPKSSVSTSLSDCLDGLRYLIDSGVKPHNIAIAGDSAGGYLALRVALESQRRGIGRLGAVACISPIIDLEPSAKLAGPDADRDPLFPASALDAMWTLISAAEEDEAAREDLRHPATASPAELAALPPLLIQVGGEEILRPDSDALVGLSAVAGGAVRLDVFPGQIHVFQAGADFIPEGKLALDRLTTHILASLAVARTDKAA
ncbi:alpha/beta hydrolase fold domain-containing protein [Gordonia sp. CPCC 205333]|uniref:alpha/beta hydrolase fold domain-containing protein n=1 Tax=Gordonia sp. CPCC 205333 TaxID=3140790 RepID=UPI003AF34565